ncbi:unnamed protein product [Peronospora farinosa]|uniref:Fascin domain-containing protein n=1 Tax=Peronospora farinosa TaxID=134698 RepID=A0AAV0UUF4_9STRA|nr:unnamed protein product [Peronospora farinosa]
MVLTEIPFGVPVILQSIRFNRNLQNPLGSKKARFLTDNRDIYEQLILHRVRDDKIAIQSGHNGRFLQVCVSGECVFDPTEVGAWELFTMETDSSCALYFVSCHTGNVLQCDYNNVAKCANQNRQDGEAWRIVEPRFIATCHSRRLGASEDVAKYLKIEQIVMSIFDGPDSTTASSTLAVPADKEA